MDRNAALNVVEEAITRVVPGADIASLDPDAPFRDVLDFDSLDFLSFAEVLSERTGLLIGEHDYPRLTTLNDTVAYLVTRIP